MGHLELKSPATEGSRLFNLPYKRHTTGASVPTSYTSLPMMPYIVISVSFLNFIYLFLAALGLHCCMYSLVAVVRVLTAVPSLVEHRLQGAWASEIVVQGLSYSVACEIFPNQGSNLGPLHWQADS